MKKSIINYSNTKIKNNLKQNLNTQIFKECIQRLDEVYSVIMTYGGTESMLTLNKIDDVQNHLEEILEIERDLHSNEIIIKTI
jgi:hypothetical protein